MNLDGARAVVTGGASGIGAAVVGALEDAGASVVVLDLASGCDISDEAQVVSAFGSLEGLDVAVLCAGIGGMSPVLSMGAAEWDRVIGVNLRGTFLCLREAARTMVAHGTGGAIVAVSSVSGFLADRRTSHYNVSKAGVDMLVRIAARELGPRGIRVVGVAPGTTSTPLFAPTARVPGYQEKVAARAALGRLGTPSDIAEAVLGVLGMDWVTGQIVVADGGVSLFSPIDVEG